MKLNREFKIGFFGIIMIAALYWGVNFLKGTDLFSSTVHYYAAYDQVNGLQPSASIVIKGFKVGSVIRSGRKTSWWNLPSSPNTGFRGTPRPGFSATES